jgi:site-specific DNA-cytosine methylase
MKPLRVLSLFDGIACARLALHNLGIPVEEYVACEIEPNAIRIAKKNWPNIRHVGDVTQFHIVPGQFDIILAGSPCQGFSRSGKGLNFEDPRSKLYFEFVRLLREGQPKWFFLENNKMKKEWEDIITNDTGVNPIKINAALVSCQNRERLFWTNIPNDGVPSDRKIMLRDIIGYYDEKIWVYPRGYNQKMFHSYKGKCPCITVSSWEHNFFYMRNGEKVAFTAEQVEQIQGLPIGYTEGVSNSQRFKKVGNGWSIPVIEHLFDGLLLDSPSHSI